MFEFLKRKKPITGEDEKGGLFDIMITNKEEISESAFKELSVGCGDGNGYKENLV